LRHLGESRPPQGIAVAVPELPPEPPEIAAVLDIESVEHRDAAAGLEDVSLDREHPAALDDGARALERGTGLAVGREMWRAGGRVRSARRVPVGFAPDQRRLEGGSPAQAVARAPCR